MKLKDEAKKIFSDLFGEEITKRLDEFENPEKYPEDFLDECKYFLSELIGEENAKARIQPLYKEYINRKSKNKR